MVEGFHIRDDGTRVPTDYGSQEERLYCETSELLEHGHHAEAHRKLDEYLSLSGGCFHMRDASLILKVEAGYLNVERTAQNVKNAADVWAMAAPEWCGEGHPGPGHHGPCSAIVQYAFDIVDHFKSLHGMPTENFDDLTGTTVEQIAKLLNFIINSFVVPSAQRGGPTFQEDDDFLLPIQSGIRILIEQGEGNMAKKFYDKVASVGYSSFMKETITERFEYADELDAEVIAILEFIVDHFVVPRGKADYTNEIQIGIRHLIEYGEGERAREIYNRIIASGNQKYVAFMEGGEYQWQ